MKFLIMNLGTLNKRPETKSLKYKVNNKKKFKILYLIIF